MSKTRMGKRVASLLLSLVMMLSLLPTTVYATGETQDVISEEIGQNMEDGNVSGEGETGADDPQPAADNAEGEEDAADDESGDANVIEGEDGDAANAGEGEGYAAAPQSGEEGDAAPLVAANVAKIGETEYATLKEAIEAATDGATITLLANCEVSDYVLDKRVTIQSADGQQYEIKGLTEIGGIGVTLKNVYLNLTGTLEIGGTNTTLTNCYIRAKDVSYEDDAAFKTGGNTNLTKLTGTDVTLVGCTIDGEDKDGSYFDNMCLMPASATNVTIRNCEFHEGWAAIYYGAISGKVEIDHCTFTKIHAYSVHVADADKGTTVSIKNSDLIGWLSFGSSVSSVDFENCTLGRRTDKLDGSGESAVATYTNTTFTNCKFTEDYTNTSDEQYTRGVYVDDTVKDKNVVVTMNGCNVVDEKGVVISGKSVRDIVNTSAMAESTTAIVAIDADTNDAGAYISGTFVGSESAIKAKLAEGYTYDSTTGTVTKAAESAYVTVNGVRHGTLDAAIAAAAPDANGVITYAISGQVKVTSTENWIQVVQENQKDTVKKVEFVGAGEDAEISIENSTSVLADQGCDIDVSFTNLTLSHPDGKWVEDLGHATNYFTCFLRNTNAAENTVTYTNCTFPNGVCNNQYGKTVFDGCEFTNKTSGNYNLWNYGGSTEVKNSKFTGTRGIKAYDEGITMSSTQNIVVENTSFTGLTEKAAIVVSKPTNVTLAGVDVTDCANGLITRDISGNDELTIGANGTGIKGTFDVNSDTSAEAAKKEFNISAGTFTSAVDEGYLAEGFTITESTDANGNKTYGVTEKAAVNYDPNSKTITNVTPDNVQAVLDGQYGSLDGMTVILSAGVYDALELGRATAYEGSNTAYMVGGFDENADNYQKFNTAKELIDYKNDTTKRTPSCYYIRSMKGVTIRAEDDATVKVKGLTATSDFVHGTDGAPAYDYVLDIPIPDNNKGFNLAQNWQNVTFEGITFTAGVDINSSLAQTTISGTTFKNCTFVGSNEGIIPALRYYNENNDGKVSGLTVANCEFSNWYQGIYTMHVKDITVDGSEFTTTGHNAIAIQDNNAKDACNHGKVVITNNVFTGIGDRVIRFNNVAAGTVITITGNTATNSGKKLNDGTVEIVAATTIAGSVAIDMTSKLNTWGDKAVLGKGFAEVYVAAIGDTKFETLANAFAAAKDGDTITLLANCSGDGIQVTAGKFATKGLTVDFNSYSYTVGGVLVGSTGTASNGFQLNKDNKITFKNGAIYGDASVAGDTTTEWSGAPAIMIQNYCNLTLQNMNVAGGKETCYTLSNNNGNVVIGDTTIKAGKGTQYGPFAFDVCRYGSYPSVSVTVKGNSVIDGNVEISGTIGAGQSRQLNIEGGKFEGTFSVANNPANIAISGGTFKTEIKAEWCAEGYIPTQNADGTYGVKQGSYVAAIGSTNYETLEAAITAAKKGKTVKLLTDVEQNSELSIDKSITLDLAGHKIYNTVDIWDEKATPHVVALINIESGAEVTITGNGTIEAKKDDCYTIYLDDGNLTIENGTFVGNISAVQVFKGTLTINGGHFSLIQKMADGRGEDRYLINCIDEAFTAGDATVAIYGGTFVGFDPNVSPEAKVDGKVPSFAGEGVGVDKDENGNFTAKAGMTAQILDAEGNSVAAYETLAEAVKAAENGQTIKLLANCESERIDLEKKSVKVDLNGKTLTSTAAYDVMFCAKNGNTINIDGTTEGSKLVGTLMVTAGTDGHIVINGGTYENAEYCPIYVNGAVSSDESTVTIKDATVIALAGTSDQDNGAAIYLAGYAVSKFTNVTVSAPVTGIEIRAGKLTLDNCDVTGGKGEIAESANGNGTTVKNAALAISQHNTKKVIDVTINGGTYTGTAALYQTDVQGTGSADVKAEVKSGTFIGIVEAKTSGTIAVSGGTFSSEVPDEYCAAGYVPATTKDAEGNTVYTVEQYRPVEVWTDFSGTKVADYTTIEEAVANLGENKWIVVGSNYTLTENFTIPEGVYLDVATGVTLTIADGVTLTVAANAKRLGVRDGATVVNNGTIMVCGTDYNNGKVMVQSGGTLDVSTLSVPEDYFLENNGTKYYAALATFTITYADGSSKTVGALSSANLAGAAKATLLRGLEDFAGGVIDGVADGFVFDLGGHTLKGKTNATSYMLKLNEPATLTNGTISYASNDATHGALWVCSSVVLDSSLTVDGGAGYAAYMDGYGITLTVNGTVKTDGAYAITGNGLNSGDLIDDCDITVNDGAEISATNGIGIYHPQLGTVTVNGGTITGHTGIQMCAGKLVVSGGEITSTGANEDHTGSENAMMDGAAISIVNRNYPGGIPTAEISGGTFKASGKDALAIRAYDYTNEKVADWTDAGEYVNISGGTFSSIPENMTALCAEGYVAVQNDEGAYVVQEKQIYVVSAQSRIAGTNSSIANVIGGGQISNDVGTTMETNSVSGYTFLGWYVGYTTSNNGTLVSKDRSFLYTPTANVTLTAVYQPVSGGTAKLTVSASKFTITGKSASQSGYQTYTRQVGSEITVEFTDTTGTFLYWVNGSEKVVSTSAKYTFTLGSNTTLSAVVAQSEVSTALVVFMSAYNQVMSAETYSTQDTIEFPIGPTKTGSSFVCWSMTEAQIKEAMATESSIIVEPVYADTDAKYTITVAYKGITKDADNYELTVGEGMRLTAKEQEGNMNFLYWTDANDKILSYSTVLPVIHTADVTYYAVYGESTEKKETVVITGVSTAMNGNYYQIAYAMNYALLDGQTLVQAGFVRTSDASKANNLTLNNADKVSKSGLTTSLGQYTYYLNASDSTKPYYVRAFLQYADEAGTVHTVYSGDVISGSYDTLNNAKGE